jgi:hypothetical protein
MDMVQLGMEPEIGKDLEIRVRRDDAGREPFGAEYTDETPSASDIQHALLEGNSTAA